MREEILTTDCTDVHGSEFKPVINGYEVLSHERLSREMTKRAQRIRKQREAESFSFLETRIWGMVRGWENDVKRGSALSNFCFSMI